MKFDVTPNTPLSALDPFYEPAREFHAEKRQSGTYDDWNEAERTEKWVKKALCDASGSLCIYYLKEQNEVVGSAFALLRSAITQSDLAANGVTPASPDFAHVTCIHLKKALRGKGKGQDFLANEVFADLKAQGIRQVYIKSSHPKAFALYERLGKCVGHYAEPSDQGLYLRYGNIYQIDLA